jgi:hypothetical protein
MVLYAGGNLVPEECRSVWHGHRIRAVRLRMSGIIRSKEEVSSVVTHDTVPSIAAAHVSKDVESGLVIALSNTAFLVCPAFDVRLRPAPATCTVHLHHRSPERLVCEQF